MAITNDVSSAGVRAAQQRAAASAHNTANLQTDAFERQQISSRESPTGGVRARLDTVEQIGILELLKDDLTQFHYEHIAEVPRVK